jgi:hypothetical protein
MHRRLWVLILSVVTIASWGADAFACGDKFLRVGRSPRFRAYASVHPSSILIYAPRWKPRGVADFEQMLKRAGHKPVTVTTPGAMSQALVAGRYQVVITSSSDTSAVRKEIDALPSGPALLPLMYKATEAEVAQAAATYRGVLRPERMTPFQALEEIDRLLGLRLKETDAVSAR